jgi:hypothetical protein
MGKHYDESVIPVELRRDFDVYDRIKELGIDLGNRDELVSLKGRSICGAIVHESGLVYLSGVGMGEMQMSDDPETVAHGQAAAAQCAQYHLRTLHWTLSCGGEGDLNDVLYTVKAIGMVVSTDVAFNSGPAVTNGYTKVWQDVFGGAIGHYAQDGADASYSGVHARSAIGGFTGRFSLEPEMIVAIPPTLSRDIITNRGWVFPLIPSMYDKVLGK